MPEPVGVWWARRQWSRRSAVPYEVGAFRTAWAQYPVLVRQYHPDRNSGIVLTQVPPTAEVWLTWECDVGHLFVATPAEQRGRPGRERRRSVWCPECTVLASPRRWPTRPEGWPESVPDPQRIVRTTGRQTLASAPGGGARSGAGTAGAMLAGGVPGAASPGGSMPAGAVATSRPARGWAPGRGSGAGARGAADAAGGAARRGRSRPAPKPLCTKTPRLPIGSSFSSECAPATASAAEAELRQGIAERLEVSLGDNAIMLASPFFEHMEAWPDVILPELRVAIEYDTTGRHGLEHVGRREDVDRRKDRLIRAAGWEVVRIRTGRLQPLGPWDLELAGVSGRGIDRLVDRLREVRGPLFVDAYRR